MTVKRKNKLIVHRFVKNNVVTYKNTSTGKEATKTEYFKQFANDTNYPFFYKDLTKGEKLSLKSLQRIKINNKFVNKEKDEKIRYHLKTKDIDLKDNDASNMDANLLRDILKQARTTWRNSDSVLKEMIDKHKRGVNVKIKYQGKEYTGNNAIIVFTQYVDFLKKKAEGENKKLSHALFLTRRK